MIKIHFSAKINHKDLRYHGEREFHDGTIEMVEGNEDKIVEAMKPIVLAKCKEWKIDPIDIKEIEFYYYTEVVLKKITI